MAKRYRNDKTLSETLVSVLRRRKTLTPSDAAEAAKKAGYRTTAEPYSLRIMCNNALLGLKFKRVGRGMYELRKGR